MGGTMKRLLSLLTVVTFVAIPNVSFAQDSNLVLEEVVVTATKKRRERSRYCSNCKCSYWQHY
jgi:hypothetical protein